MYFLVIFVFRENIMLFGTRQLLLFKFIISLSEFSNTWTPPSRNNDETSLTLICVVKISFFRMYNIKSSKKSSTNLFLIGEKIKSDVKNCYFSSIFVLSFNTFFQKIEKKKLFQTSCQFYCQFFHIKFSLDLVKWFFFIVFHRKIW